MTETDRDDNDADWLSAVVRQYEGPLVRYAQRLLGDVHRAQDVAQDTFLKLCREPREKIVGRLRPWLYSVCRNRAVDVLKKEQRMTTLTQPQAQELVSPDRGPAAALERQEELGHAAAVLAQLPANQQEVVRLSEWKGSPQANFEPLTHPDQFGARASKLTQLLLQGHAGVTLSDEEYDRLITWMDTNALFYGTFDPEAQRRQQRGERIAGPALE
jgi:RNA polymerase sigma-70 factor (ECF subfamily)